MLNILSLFDGMSCGQLAIQQLGIKDYKYYASEIDKFAIQITQKNFPNTYQIGDIKKLDFSKYNYNRAKNGFGLLLGGSPCQGFSFAGKQLNFNDPRSALFFEYVRILKEVKPKYFLLENVKMKKEYQDVISEYLFGIQPILIDSALLTGGTRKRLYWVGELQQDGNYKQVKIEQPKNKGILLKDILEDTKTNVSEKYIEYAKNAKFKQDRPIELPNKAKTLLASSRVLYKIGDNYKKLNSNEMCKLQNIPIGYLDGISETQKYKMLGNGWTIDVIVFILSHLNLKNDK